MLLFCSLTSISPPCQAEPKVVKVAEVFRLTNMDEMKRAEKSYFPQHSK